MEVPYRICGWEECGVKFKPKVHNAVYHSSECRRLATNAKVLQKYYERKGRRMKGRVCRTKSCTTFLSTYNEESICEACKVNRLIERLVGWGWSRTKLEKEWSY